MGDGRGERLAVILDCVRVIDADTDAPLLLVLLVLEVALAAAEMAA